MMSAMRLSQIAYEVGAVPSVDAEFFRVCTDTRKLQKNDLFLALSGENYDGNEFIERAVEAGAIAVVAKRAPTIKIPHLLVNNPLLALGLIARNNRRQFNGPVIALTGSTGKTTCKEMLAAILSECGNVLATQGNDNNEVGVPQTLMNIGSQHDSVVVEMGASRVGDIAYLCQFAEPSIALVTNAMAAHIEGFGDIESVAQTKGQVFESLAENGVAVINLDDRFATDWQTQAGDKRIIFFSVNNSKADIYARDVQPTAQAGIQFILVTDLGEAQIEMSMLGLHNVANAVAAAAVAIAAGASLQQIKAGLAKARAVVGRLKVMNVDGDKLIIDDSYNASPGSVKAAIDALIDCSNVVNKPEATNCLVLGTMAELGAQSPQLHQQVAHYAREKGVQQLIAVGEYADLMIAEFMGSSMAFHNNDDLLQQIDQQIDADIVLVKGSRSARMENIVHALIERSTNVHKKGEH